MNHLLIPPTITAGDLPVKPPHVPPPHPPIQPRARRVSPFRIGVAIGAAVFVAVVVLLVAVPWENLG